ncbi:MAG: hypothetical protein D8M59_09695 [Planctomycetes bacterium]|nr:hypothetical protein [Planctomycetota bacterium]NOG53468.1 GIY-YIG nuclease family protein [Planctomycetota bacterium]
MPFYVYVLRSESTGHRYTGQTNHLTRRLAEHNDPKTKPMLRAVQPKPDKPRPADCPGPLFPPPSLSLPPPSSRRRPGICALGFQNRAEGDDRNGPIQGRNRPYARALRFQFTRSEDRGGERYGLRAIHRSIPPRDQRADPSATEKVVHTVAKGHTARFTAHSIPIPSNNEHVMVKVSASRWLLPDTTGRP